MKRCPVAVRSRANVSRRLPSPHLLRLVLAALLGVALLAAALAVPAVLAARDTSGADTAPQLHTPPDRSAPAEPAATNRGPRAPAAPLASDAVIDGDGPAGVSAMDTRASEAQGINDRVRAVLGPTQTGDAHLDAVFANVTQTNRVCLGDGAGGFSCDDVSADTRSSERVALGFVDGDNNLDAVFANQNQTNRVCLGDGAGSFACSDVSPDTQRSFGVALGFVDGDDNLDAIFANQNQTNRVCLGDGAGGFSCSDVSVDARASFGVALGFVDGDNNLDAVFANQNQTNRVCLGDGAGGFSCSDVSPDTRASSRVALGFVDGDTDLDAVFANTSVQRNRVCLGDGAGGFACSDVSPDTRRSVGVALGNVNTTVLASGIDQRVELTCELDDHLAVFPDERWIVEIVVSADETQDINNVANVTSAAVDPNPDNNEAFVKHDVTDVADLSVTKEAVGEVAGVAGPVADQVTAGRPMTYTLTVNNSGPSTAENATLQDRLPPWIVVTGVDTSQGTCNSGTPGEPLDELTCGLGTLAVNASATVTLTALVDAAVSDGAILENDALVTSDVFDADNSNNYATHLTTVGTAADLAIGKSDRPDPVVAGEVLAYTLAVTNNGPSVARDVLVVDPLPADLTALSVNVVNEANATCSIAGTVPDRIDCGLGDVAVGKTITVVVTSRVASNATGGLINTATVSSTTPDPTPANNSANQQTTIDTQADLEIEKTGEPDKVFAGEQVKYTVTVTNLGPSDAQNVVVADSLPSQAAYEIDTGACAESGGTVTCSLGTLPAGTSERFEVWAQVDAGVASGTVITNTASVGSTTPDPAGANNTAQAETLVLNQADFQTDLTLTKTGPSRLLIGGQATYMLNVTNHGPSTAANVQVWDDLPVDGGPAPTS